MRGHTKFLGGLKNRGGKVFRGLLQRGVMIKSLGGSVFEVLGRCSLWLMSPSVDPLNESGMVYKNACA